MYATIFLILMSLGIALTRFKVFSFQKALISSIGRVIAGPIIGFLIIKYYNLTGFAAGVFTNTVFNAFCCIKLSYCFNLFTKKNC